MLLCNFIGCFPLLELAQEFWLRTPDPFSSHSWVKSGDEIICLYGTLAIVVSYHGHKNHKHSPITLCGSYSCNEMHWNCPCVWVLISIPLVLPWQHLLCILMEWSVSERLGSAPRLHSWHRKLVAWAEMLHVTATYSAASSCTLRGF